jgi:hypothetical protein
LNGALPGVRTGGMYSVVEVHESYTLREKEFVVDVDEEL